LAQKKSIPYEMLRPFVWMGIHFFFRRVVVAGAHRVPQNRPVVMVANHQNALLDPVVLCVSTNVQLNWLTRADVFKNPLVNRFLRRINMLPVYRERDRVVDLHDRNNEIFRLCYERMKNNAIIGIFPEGTHRGKKQLVPLKKGLARLVIGAYESGVRDLCILPVGLDYESFYEPQKNLLVKIGEPIELDVFLERKDVTHAKLHAEITDVVHHALRELMIHIDHDDVHSEILALKPLIDSRMKGESLMKKYDVFHAFARELDEKTEYHPFLNHEVNRYRTGMHEMKIDEGMFSNQPGWLDVLFVVGALPIAVIAAIVFWPMQLFTERFVHTVIKDTLFRNSIRISFWTFITPLYLWALYGVLRVTGFETATAMWVWMSIPAGLITLPWWRNVKRLAHAFHVRKIRGTKEFKEWLAQREIVLQWLNKIPYLKSDV
jgi:1-acyl-sn-glycerol-3-phosphate acyltransferase